MSRIVITVINYSNEKEVLKYAQMLSEQSVSIHISLIVIINKKGRNSGIDLEKEMQKIDMVIEIVDPKENLGYLNGCLYGYREYYKKYNSVPEWLFVSNTDIDIHDNTFFERFLQKDYEKEIWCAAPSVYSPRNNSFDNPHYASRCSLRKVNRIIWIHEHPALALIYFELVNMKARVTRHYKLPSQYVYSVHGCFFALRDEFIKLIENNHYQGFLYSEEAYLAEIILQHNRRCFYDDSLEVIHNENSVTGHLGVKGRAKLIADSMKYIRKEFYLDNRKTWHR